MTPLGGMAFCEPCTRGDSGGSSLYSSKISYRTDISEFALVTNCLTVTPLKTAFPQGSVLSVTLFAIAINSIASVVREPVKTSLFVDDFAIFCSSSSISVIQRQLQLVFNKLYEWSMSSGFKFSPTKCTGVHFCRIYHLHSDPILYLGGNQLFTVCQAGADDVHLISAHCKPDASPLSSSNA